MYRQTTKMTAAAGGAEMTEKTRIYVGGLRNGVTEDDLRKTFSALGEVVAVDIVRTKGRSFAYLDFLPSSDKSLSKLFSTYNGCMWKGGKLRLEKAKEHFLIRLRREWQEDADRASNACSHDADPSESHHSLEKPKKPSTSDNMKLRIFFPKLGKVKSLASAGIGKHKYSFQRVQVPSVPNHFCDCAEHSGPFLTAKGKSTSAFEDEKNLPEFESASAGINEQELDIMNLVMNKLFEREKLSKQTIREPELVDGRGDSTNSSDELLAAENDDEDHLTDEDNLIINVVSKKSDSLDLLREMKTVTMNQEPVAKKLKPFNDRKPKNDHDSQGKKTVPLSKNKKSTQSEVNDGSYTVITEMARNPEIHLNTQGDSRSEIVSGSKLLESNSLRSKSTWKDLISQRGNTSFSISDLISKVPQGKKVERSGDNLNPRRSENVHYQENMILRRNKKRKSDTSRNKTVYSVPETTMNSQMHMDAHEDTTRELESVTQQSTTPDTLLIVTQQKEEEPRTDDLDVPLPTISQAFCMSDILPSVLQQNEKEPRDDNLDVPLTKNIENKNLDKHENAERQTDSKDLEASPGKQNEDTIRVARGASWRHKSSWTQLVSTNDSPFSISQFVPNPSLEKHGQQVDVLGNGISDSELRPANENLNTGPATVLVPASNDQSTAGGVAAQAFPEKDHEGISKKNEVISKKNEVSSSSLIKKRTPERRRILSLGDLDSEETCPFMRTEASMKEWRKLKAGARISHKKKRSVKEST